MSSPPGVTVSVTTGAGSGVEVVNAGVCVGDVVVLVCVSVWVDCWLDPDSGAVVTEGEGSGVGVELGLGSEDGADSDVGGGVALVEGEDSGAGVGLGEDESEVGSELWDGGASVELVVLED